MLRINGVNRLACKVKDLLATGGRPATITIEPTKGLPVLKDLIVDTEPFFEAYRAVKPCPMTYGNEPTGAEARTASTPIAAATTSAAIFKRLDG